MPTNDAPQNPKDDGEEEPGNGPGKASATKTNVMWMSAFSMGLTLLLFYLLIELWPHPTPAMVYSTSVVAATADTTKRDTAAGPAGTTANRPDTTRADSATDTTGTGGGTGQPATPAVARSTPRTEAPLTSAASTDSLWMPQELNCDRDMQLAWARSHRKVVPDHVDPKCVNLFTLRFALWDEQRLLILVMLAGALGAMLHVLRSLGWYIGQRKLVRSWLPRYVHFPFVGATIGVIVYVVVRGGFFGSTTSVSDTSPFGFVAFAAVLGLFSEQAILKLKQVSETMLAAPKPGAESAPQKTDGSGGNGGGGNGGNPPGGGVNPPGGEVNPPGGGVNPPGGGVNPPGGGVNPPGGGVNPPGGGVNPPDDGVNPPGGGVNPPDGGVNPPVGEENPPVGGANPPGDGINPPDVGNGAGDGEGAGPR